MASAASTALALVVLAAAAGSSLAVQAQPEDGAPPLTVLLFHPNDGVDPLGFAATPGNASSGEADPFSLRYAPLVAEKGRFDFPFFVADGVLPIEAIPDPAKPYVSALEAYRAAVRQREAEETPAVLEVSSLEAAGEAVVSVRVTPRTDLTAEDLHLRLAVVEDHVEYQPPPGLTNGVTDHRFTVRAYADLGPIPGMALGRSDHAHTFQLSAGWAREQLTIAAWLQQDAPSPRFDAREVVQATHARLGQQVVAEDKGVLFEMLSATWCDPCLYGDRAAEAIAVEYGVATAASPGAELRYLDLRTRDLVSLAIAVVVAVGFVVLARRSA